MPGQEASVYGGVKRRKTVRDAHRVTRCLACRVLGFQWELCLTLSGLIYF